MWKRKKFKHILITEETFQTLKKMGNAGDSFNDVLKKMLEKNERVESGSEAESVPNLKEMLEKNKRVESGSRVGELAKF